MKTIRVRDPEGVDEMDAFLMEDGNISHEDFVLELKKNLIHSGDNVYLLQTWDKDKTGEWKLVAFMLSVMQKQNDFVFIYQAWRDPEETTPTVLDTLLQRTILWGDNEGKKVLRMETIRDPEKHSERWGFSPRSVTMELQDSDEFELPAVRKEEENGTV